MNENKIILCDPNIYIVTEWKKVFQYESNVVVVNSRFQDVPKLTYFLDEKAFIICSAGNSYGIMGGGIDAQIRDTFPGIESDVRQVIKESSSGELDVGHLIKLHMDNYTESKYIRLYYVPTMRVPMRLQSAENVYLAAKAIFEAFKFDSYFVRSAIVIPGLGGLCGGVPPKQLAKAMYSAYCTVFKEVTIKTHQDMRRRQETLDTIFTFETR